MDRLTSMQDELAAIFKAAADLTPQGRAEIPKKDFALTSRQSSTGERAYPIDTEARARAALGFVGMHGSDAQKHEVYQDVARKYPQLAAKSSVPALRGMAKEKDADMGAAPPVNPTAPMDMMQDKAGGVGSFIPRAANAARGLLPGPAAAAGPGLLQRLASDAGTHKAELAGLGILAAPSVDHLQAKIRAGLAGDKAPGAAHQRQFMGETAHALTELGGLGVLAGPSVAHLLGKHANLIGEGWNGALGKLLRTNVTGGPGFLVAPRAVGEAAASTAKTVTEKAKQLSPNVWLHGGKKYLKNQLPPGAL